MSDITDPIDGLIRYVNEIKPFHSKIIEVLTEYVYEESINVTLSEATLLDVGIVIGRVNVEDSESTKFGGGYDDDPYDSARYFPVIALNSTLEDGAFNEIPVGEQPPYRRGYDHNTRMVLIPGDQTATYRPGREVEVQLTVHNHTSGIETPKSTSTWEIQSSTYVTTGQTNGIFDTQHTRLILDGLVNETTQQATLAANESWGANVKLKPVDIVGVVHTASTGTDTNTARVRYSTVSYPIVPPQMTDPTTDSTRIPPFPLEDPLYTAPIPAGANDLVKFENYIILAGDTTASYPYSAILILQLANSTSQQFTVSASRFDGVNTFVELLQPLDVNADYNNAQVVEGFFGIDQQFVRPTGTSDIPEGLTQTNIVESIRFSWADFSNPGSPVVMMDFTQFLIKGTESPDKILLALDGRDPNDFLSAGDTINVIEHSGANGQYEIDSITVTAGDVEIITVEQTINTSSDTGFLETT